MTDPRTPRRRLIMLVIGTLVWVAAIAVRLVDVQLIRAGELERLAERQQLSIVDIAPVRGAIRDRHGVELALSKDVRSVYAVPGLVASPRQAAAALAPILGRSQTQIRRRLLKTDRDFVWVARKVSDRQADQVAALELAGIGFRAEPKRFYPRGELAAHVLGFVGLDNEGLAGLELKYDKKISGIPGYEFTLRDARGVRFLPEPDGERAEPGHDLVLTLDAGIQYLVERELAAAVAANRAKKGVAVVLDPATGDVLAMAGYPTFSPDRYGAVKPSVRRNPAVAEAYEPGSTFKVVTFAAALERSKLRLDEHIDCGRGKYRVGRHVIKDHKVFDVLTPPEIIQHSSNVGAMVVGARLAKADFHAAIRAFGFGATTGVELPGESPGLLQRPDKWSALSKPSISMGQEIGVTALQLTTAVAAIANGGLLMKPRLVQHTADASGDIVEPVEVRVRRRVMSETTAARLRTMMETVVGEDGTAASAAIAGIRIAGKTGTAEKVVGGRYAPGYYVASFAAFAPADDPQLVVLVAIDEPRGGSHYGGVVAAPIVRRILEQALPRVGVTVGGNVIEAPLMDYYPDAVAAPNDAATGIIVAQR